MADFRAQTSKFGWMGLLIIAVAVAACGESSAPSASDPLHQAAATNSGKRIVVGTADASRHLLGEVVPDFSFRDLEGRSGSLAEFCAEGPLALVMRDRSCPVTKKYGPTTANLERRFQARGVRFLYLNLTSADSVAEARADRDAYGFTGTYVHDPSGAPGRLLGVTSTSEVFVLDQSRRMHYRGAIDDRFGVGVSQEFARRHFFSDALESVLAKTPVEVPATTAPGCFLDFSAGPAAPAVDSGAPTFHEDVEPILQRYCQNCHREGEIAPFYLQSYDDVAGRKRMIRHVLEEGSMPPWYADDGYGGPWQNDLRMGASSKQTLLDWIAAGCPKGDAAAAPAPLQRHDDWKIGKPDLVVKVPEPIEVPPEGFYDYVYRVVDTGLSEDRFIEKLELRSDNLTAVHHIVIFEYRDEMSEWTGTQRGWLALQGFYGIWFPGTEPILYTKDRGKLLKAGTRFLFQIHYNGNGETVRDTPKAGFVFAKEKPSTLLRCDAAYTVDIEIPPGCEELILHGDFDFDRPGLLYGILPHMHVRGVACQIDMIYPDGRNETVLRVSEYDFNWQQCYRFEKPIPFPKGTKFRMYGRYDNSKANPGNPDPTKHVTFGLSTYDEMLVGYFEWAPTAN